MIRAAGFIGLAALALMLPALIHGASTLDSGAYNYLWTSQFAAEMARGDLYPRWLPQSFEGLGSPTFYFYPPLVYWISGALALLTDVRHAIAIAGFLLLFSSGATMYLWLRGKAAWPLLGALLYMLAPYHLGDFYARSALAEFGAFVWLPLIALGIEGRAGRWSAPLLAVSLAGLICTHLPTALLASAILIPPLVVKETLRERMALVRCAAAGLAGVALAAFYLTPAFVLQSHTLMGQLMWVARFSPDHWSVFELMRGKADPALGVMTSLAIKWGLVAIVAALAALAARGRYFWAVITLWALACSLGVVPLLSLPVLDKVQFPWRALAIVEFAGVTAAALAPIAWAPMAAAAAIILQTAPSLAHAAMVGVKAPMDPDLLARHVDAVEYLPADFRPLPVTMSRPDLSALAGPLVRGPVSTVTTRPDGSISMKASADGEVVVRRAAFPRWQVMSPGPPVALGPGPLIRFQARAGHVYRLKAVRTPAETLGWWISLVGVLLTVSLAGPSDAPVFARKRKPRLKRAEPSLVRRISTAWLVR